MMPLLVALADHPALSDSLIFQFNGLVVVFTALCSIWLMLEITGAFFRRRTAASASPAVSDAQRPAAAPAAVPGPDPETVAVIMSAVHVALGTQRLRITAIAPASPSPDWAREGRREIFSSHRVR